MLLQLSTFLSLLLPAMSLLPSCQPLSTPTLLLRNLLLQPREISPDWLCYWVWWPNEASDTIDFDAMNAQIPYGAYDIVAIDTVITVGKGQTALSISKMMLGTEYTIYIVVANDGNDQPQPGQPYRIPKLQLRSKK